MFENANLPRELLVRRLFLSKNFVAVYYVQHCGMTGAVFSVCGNN